jgi:hypothetical protein
LLVAGLVLMQEMGSHLADLAEAETVKVEVRVVHLAQ